LTKATGKYLVKDIIRNSDQIHQYYRDYTNRSPERIPSDLLYEATGMSWTQWNKYCEKINQESLNRQVEKQGIEDSFTHKPFDRSLANDLLALADEQPHTQKSSGNPYSTVDQDIKLSSISISGFRGIRNNLNLDLTNKGKPGNVLLWGDNGYGKSSIIDALEFSLQSKVDRSRSYSSEYHPSARNLGASQTSVTVTLSDGSVEQRSIVKNEAAQDIPSSDNVRPGFKISPLAIRRSDILRFLSSESLTRATIFFDYFPALNGQDSSRPDELLRAVEEEQVVLGVSRSALALQLENLTGRNDVKFSDGQQLEEYIKEYLKKFPSVPVEDRFSMIPDAERNLLSEMRQIQDTYRANKHLLDKGVQKLNPVAYKEQTDRLTPVLRAISPRISAAFSKITNIPHLENISVVIGKSGPVSLDVVVKFSDGTAALAQQCFSEGYNDLISLLFFVEMLHESSKYGQAKIIVLDDALQSVDSVIRTGFIRYVLEEFKGWQIIVTGHDKAWLQQLQGIFSRITGGAKTLSISDWSVDGGPIFSDVSPGRIGELRDNIERGSYFATASLIGPVLEELSNALSWRLGIKVSRTKDDKYTLGQLWPGVGKKLRRSPAAQVVDRINYRLDVRNIVGAHYSDWAASLSGSEVSTLAKDVIELYSLTYCTHCGEWISSSGAHMSCKCKSLSY
jgi:hypothetical protein